MPTKLGNVTRAFENYPARYGMDGVTYFPRLLNVLATQNYLPYINQARSTVDFLLYMSLLMTILGLECFVVRIFFTASIHWIFPIVAFLAAWVFYQAAIQSLEIWAAFFKAGFDLFRYHLAKALGLKVATSFSDEKRQWESLTQFWNDIEPETEYKHFNYDEQRQEWPVKEPKKKE